MKLSTGRSGLPGSTAAWPRRSGRTAGAPARPPARPPPGLRSHVCRGDEPAAPPSGAGVVHPRHRPVRGDQPTPPVMLYNQDRISACPAGPAPPRGQQVGVRHETRTDERTHDRVLQTAPTARPVALPGAKPRRCRVGVACIGHAITLPPTGPATLHERYPRSRNRLRVRVKAVLPAQAGADRVFV